jgi:uroporphyrin-3 C-methyltransferase
MTTNQTPKPKKHRLFFFFLFLTLLLGATIVLSYPFWQQFTNLEQTLQKEIKQLSTQVAMLQKSQEKDNQAQFQTLETRINEQELAFKKLIQQIAQQPQNDEDWKIAEINYLITIAHHRLQLVQDSQGALAALITANKRLQSLNKPELLKVRTELLKKIQSLRELKHPDITGLALRLAQAQSDKLPLLQGTRESYTPASSSDSQESSQEWQQVLLEELKRLVVIRYNNQAERGFLNPKQRTIIAQILQLKLENARFFLLRHDSQNFTASIQAVREWLKHYYDKNDDKVKALQTDLAKMEKIVLNPPLPELSNLLKSLSAARGNS